MSKDHADYLTDEQLAAEIAELKAHPEKLREESDERTAYFTAPERAAETALMLERMRLVEKLYAIRKEAGLTLKQLAEKLGTTQSYITALEKGRKNATFETLFRFVYACGKKLKISML